MHGIIVQSIEAETPLDSEVIVAGILGDTVFQHKTKISLAIKQISFSGKEKEHSYKYLISLNGAQWTEYREAVEILDTTNVRARIFDQHELIFDIESLFEGGQISRSWGRRNHYCLELRTRANEGSAIGSWGAVLFGVRSRCLWGYGGV